MFSLDDQIYIAKWCEKISIGELSRGLRAKRVSISEEIKRQKQEGIFEKYKKLTDEEYEIICMRGNSKKKMRKKR